MSEAEQALTELLESVKGDKDESLRIIAILERWAYQRANNSCPLNSGTFPDPLWSERDWVCYSTATTPIWLMLRCRKTGAEGVVKDPTSEEWGWAFDCPSNPKSWSLNDRVTLMMEGA